MRGWSEDIELGSVWGKKRCVEKGSDGVIVVSSGYVSGVNTHNLPRNLPSQLGKKKEGLKRYFTCWCSGRGTRDRKKERGLEDVVIVIMVVSVLAIEVRA
jgi:hypothetical protein